MVPNNAKTINSSRLTKMVSSCLTYSDEEADAFYDEISQLRLYAMQSQRYAKRFWITAEQ